jgi:hypothetical protein
MSKTLENGWAEYTAIDREELLEYIFSPNSWEDGKIKANVYCVKPAIDTLDVGGFLDFLQSQYHRFVFPESEWKGMETPGVEAQRRADFDDDARYDGKLGELVLFVLVDGLLDLPTISHKVAHKQEPVQEVKGSDGLFFDHFGGEEALAIGEAKIYSRRSQGINDALESTERFHGTTGDSKTDHELNVAAKTLSEDLNEDETDRLIEVLGSSGKQYRTVHPIFAGYEEEWLLKIQKECTGPEELQERIEQRIRDSELELSVMDTIEEDYPELRKYWLVFFLFPLEDVDVFRERLQERIFPHSTNH